MNFLRVVVSVSFAALLCFNALSAKAEVFLGNATSGISGASSASADGAGSAVPAPYNPGCPSSGGDGGTSGGGFP